MPTIAELTARSGLASDHVSTDPTLQERAYQTLRHALIVGKLPPGKGISLRAMAEDLGVGVMPMRAAIARLSAENALTVHDNRRVSIPEMTVDRFDQLMQARLLIEPTCAMRALHTIDDTALSRIRAHDERINTSYQSGDAELYMAANYAFHFEIYRAGPSEVLTRLLESVWMQFGPFMRQVYGMVGTVRLTDKHAMAIAAIERRDVTRLKLAIEADILDGMDLLGTSIFKPLADSQPSGTRPGPEPDQSGAG
ncbi:MAG TPA: GntR family transcriptional regulator [Ensifer sp.]|nr:GntR family transcriptional regulator [Ensifer sp.]